MERSSLERVSIGVNLMIKSFAIMKKMYRFLFAVAVAATAFVGCVREPEMLSVAEEHPIHFVAQSIETRTAFSEPTGNSYPTLWTANDTKVKIMNTMFTGSGHSAEATVNPSADGTKASLVATLKDTTTYTFFAVSPASAFLNCSQKVKVNDEEQVVYRVGVTIPTSQTPTANSVDEAAQILVAQSETMTSLPEEPEKVSLHFRHWTSYGKLSLTNLNLNGATIESVNLTAEEDWAYRWYYFFADGSTSVNNGSKTITVKTSSVTNIWFACAPVDLTGKKLTVTVKTNQGTFNKTVTLPGKFESGKINCFSVNMSGVPLVSPKVYEKVTSIADLTLNSEVIIAAASDAKQYAISTSQGNNNRPAVAVIKADNKITDPGESVATFTVEEGTSSGTYAFKATNGDSDAQGYIYAAGGTKNNYLKTKKTKDASGSWTVTIGEKTVLKAGITGDNARNLLQYNFQNGASLFSCYGGNSEYRDSVALYKLVGSGGDTPVEKNESGLWLTQKAYTIAIGESIEFLDEDKLDPGYYADGGTLTYSSSDATVAYVDVDEMMIKGLKAGTCTITVTASETEHYNPAEKTCTVTVSAGTKTIAELLALTPTTVGESTTESYDMNEATVMAISGANVIVKDETGVMLLYKGSTGFAAGDRVTATGKVQNYHGLAEFSATAATKVSSGATVDHGTPVTFDEAAITSYADAPVTQYCKASGYLPMGTSSSDYMTVGSKTIALYDKTLFADKYGMFADVYGYSIGTGSNGQINFVDIQINEDATVPFIYVTPTSKTWAATETDAFTVAVSLETGGNWTFTPTGMDWATLTKNGNTLVVTPKAANTSSSAKEGSVVIQNSANTSKTATVTFSQSGAGGVTLEPMDPTNVVVGRYIIVGTYSGKTYAMNNAIQSSYYTAATEYDPTGGVLPSAEHIFTIDQSGSGYSIKGNDGKYMQIVQSGTHYNLLPTATSAYVWTFTAGTGNAIVAKGSNSGNYCMSFTVYKGTTPEFTTATSTSGCPVFYRIVE